MRYQTSGLTGMQNFSLSHTRNEMKNIFLYIFNKLKIYHLSCSIYKYDAIDIADPTGLVS